MKWGRGPADEEWFATGQPLVGTEQAVGAILGGGGGSAALTAVDPTFDVDAFVAWALTVFDRAVAAWRTRDPEPLRPVMDTAVWDAYAQHLLVVSAIPLAQLLMAAARATPALAGTTADSRYQSALVGFDVATDPAVYAALKLPTEHHTWKERWLFQRPASCRTYASGAVAVCPVCGAPAQPEESGRCRYCHADITTRTAGWLVTRTETTMARLARMDERTAQARASIAAHANLPSPPVVAAPLQPPRAGPAAP